MSNQESYTVKQVKKLYNIEVESTYHEDFYKRVLIKVYIEFKPKETNSITPDICISYGKWYYHIVSNNLSFEDFTYIRSNDMPILSYTKQEYYLDNYCETLGYEEVNKILRSLGYDVSFSPPNVEI